MTGRKILGFLRRRWVALFDGRTLDGWVQRNGTETFRVEGGTIVGRTSEGSPNFGPQVEVEASHGLAGYIYGEATGRGG